MEAARRVFKNGNAFRSCKVCYYWVKIHWSGGTSIQRIVPISGWLPGWVVRDWWKWGLLDRRKTVGEKTGNFSVVQNGLKGLENIENQYIKSDLDNKRRLIGSIFPENFQFENKKVQTADINPILDKIARFNSVNRKNKKRDKSKKEDLSRCVHKMGLEPTIPMLKDLSFLKNLLQNSSTSLP